MAKKHSFIDQARIFVQAGDGGNGHVGFHRAKFLPMGGPSGGDGGSGGDVIFIGSSHVNTLQDFQYIRHFRAEHGDKGGREQRTGKDGLDLEIKVPLGTVILDAETGEFVGELIKNNEVLVIAEGGKGGLGNIHFKSSTNQAPQTATPGEKREGKWLRLELKSLADVGIVGPPNAGKSTLLGALTHAKPKVGNYPFTTLAPSLGVMNIGEKRIALADVPGLIEGAHEGVGLGIQFLRHVARTRVLLYVVPADVGTPAKAWKVFKTTRDEIIQYDSKLGDLHSFVVLNKIDLLEETDIKKFVSYFQKKKIKMIPISAQNKVNLEKLESVFEKEFKNLDHK